MNEIAVIPNSVAANGGGNGRDGNAVTIAGGGDGAPSGLQLYMAARQALEAAYTVDEVVGIRARADALRAYAYQAKDKMLLFWAAEIKLRAERKAGNLIREMREAGEIFAVKQCVRSKFDSDTSNAIKEAKGTYGQIAQEFGTNKTTVRNIKKNKYVPSDHQPRALSDLGVKGADSYKWQIVASIRDEKFDAWLDKKKAADQVPTTQALMRAARDEGVVSSAPGVVSKGEEQSDRQLSRLKAAWHDAYPMVRERFLVWVEMQAGRHQ